MLRRPWALPLVPLYGAAVALDGVLRARGFGVRELAKPVVSVGSLSAGGAGKTPVVAALAALLGRAGIAVDILTRGFGRSGNTVGRVPVDGTAEAFGDEPLQLARAGFPVYVGRDRYLAGQAAEHDGKAVLHLLDDGFQHRRLARALDIVLLTAEDVHDTLLPAGNRREPLRALARADVVLLRAEEADVLMPVVTARSAARIWTCRRTLQLPPAAPARPLAFCALARPHSFFSMLAAAGCTPARTEAFADHAFYDADRLRRLLRSAQDSGADGFITTEKDAVKLSGQALRMLAAVGPVAVAPLTVELDDEDAILRRILQAAGHNALP